MTDITEIKNKINDLSIGINPIHYFNLDGNNDENTEYNEQINNDKNALLDILSNENRREFIEVINKKQEEFKKIIKVINDVNNEQYIRNLGLLRQNIVPISQYYTDIINKIFAPAIEEATTSAPLPIAEEESKKKEEATTSASSPAQPPLPIMEEESKKKEEAITSASSPAPAPLPIAEEESKKKEEATTSASSPAPAPLPIAEEESKKKEEASALPQPPNKGGALNIKPDVKKGKKRGGSYTTVTKTKKKKSDKNTKQRTFKSRLLMDI